MNQYPQHVPPSLLAGLPPGVDGIRATLKRMVRFVKDYRADVGIREVAQKVVRNVPSKDYAGYIRALQHFVRDTVQYVGDVRDVETVQTPKRTLEIGSGDCDDKVTLLAALLESIGFRTRFVAMGFRGGPYSHVIAEVLLGSTWIPLETILPNIEPGWRPPDATRVMVAHV